jgi:glycine oxidase
VPGMQRDIAIAGAGIFGLWQALLLALAGHRVRVLERSAEPFTDSASRYAGAMIAPFCEAESAEPIVRDLGLEAAALWRTHFPVLCENGSLVVAAPRDQGELRRFARMTEGHETIGAERLAELEPDFTGRFQTALFYPREAHMVTPAAMRQLLELARAAGAQFEFGMDSETADLTAADLIIDCRGLGARRELPDLRGVRGERILVRAPDLAIRRPFRLLHPRHPLYAVPWSDHQVLIGATVIESEDATPMTVRSALELLGMAFALHPAFGEAEIIEMSAGVRPSFPDNIPRVIVREGGRRLFVNGAFRHGFLLAPMLASVVRDHIAGKTTTHAMLRLE